MGLLVVGGLELCLNVLGMVFDFYKKATRATAERELDQAAELFVQIVLRGGMDILVGRRAAAKLAGRGLRSVWAYLGYLEDEMKLWRARQAGPGSKPAVTQDPPPSLKNNAQKGVYGEHASDVHMHNKGYTKLNDGGTLTPSTGGA